MAGKPIGIRIPDHKIYDTFIEYVKNKHGKIHGVAGLELQNAIVQFLEHPEGVNIDEIEIKHEKELRKLKQRINVCEALNKQIKPLQKSNQGLKNEVNLLKNKNNHLKEIDKAHEQLQNQHDKLRNKFDHLQERFNKSQNELNTLERENSELRVVVAKIEKMSLWERVLKRLPSEVKQLQEKQKLNK